MQSNLWQFAFSRQGQQSTNGTSPTKYTLPILAAPGKQAAVNCGAIVNVLNDFMWTNSKKRASDSGRDETPYIILKERKVKANSLAAQFLYSAGAVVDGGTGILNAFGANLSNTPFDASTAVTDVAKKAASAIGGIGEVFGLGSIGITAKSLSDSIAQQLDFIKDDSSFLKKDYLQWYRGLYITELTGWQFILPYFEDYDQSATNAWGSDKSTTGGGVILGGLTELSKNLGKITTDIAGSVSTGAYVENSQFYQYAQTGESITLKFPLINAGSATYQDVLRNWQFIYLLIYNNKPERVNVNLIEPPPIYEVTIPGAKYIPYSYIQSISVTHRGARRVMKIQVPSTIRGLNEGTALKNIDFEAIIPEAYDITITLQGLIADSKNFMYAVIEDQQVQVKDIKDKVTGAPRAVPSI